MLLRDVRLLVVIMLYVIPQFESFYEGLDVELPLLTRFFIAVAC